MIPPKTGGRIEVTFRWPGSRRWRRARTGALRFVLPQVRIPFNGGRKARTSFSARHALLTNHQSSGKFFYSLRLQQAKLFSRNLLTITSGSGYRQHAGCARLPDAQPGTKKITVLPG